MNSQIAAYIQRVTGTFLTDTCTLYKRNLSTLPTGAPNQQYDVVASGVACRVISSFAARGDAAQIAGRESLTDNYRVVLPSGTEIGNDYRILAGGVLYDVTGVVDGRTDGSDVQVRVEVIRGE